MSFFAPLKTNSKNLRRRLITIALLINWRLPSRPPVRKSWSILKGQFMKSGAQGIPGAGISSMMKIKPVGLPRLRRSSSIPAFPNS